jgi:hypothetical protein
MDVGTVGTLYRSVADGDTPAAVVARDFGGRDPQIVGIRADINTDIDWEDYVSKVVVLGQEAGDDGSTGPFRKPYGPFITWTRVVVDPNAPDGYASAIAASIYDQLPHATEGRREVKVTTDLYDVAGDMVLGDDIYVWDPDNGISDTTYQTHYQGQLIFPAVMRLIGYRWPIKRGMGVYLRTSNASPTDPTYENITPYVEFEPDDAPATLELGAASRLLRSDAYGNLVTASPNVQQTPWLEYTPTWTGSGGNPSIGNGTIKGYYKRDGTTLYLRGRIIMGSTTTYGTGEWRVSLPSSASTAGATSEYQVGAGMAVDTGTRSYGVYPVSDPGVSATVLRLFYESSADSIQASVTATTPHTWANTDVCAWNITMEVDP